MRGAECRCYLDGALLLAGTDAQLTSGRIGFGAPLTAFRIKDIKVTSEDDKIILWEGLPKLPD